jgi:Secretion system C-terminal sorting domain
MKTKFFTLYFFSAIFYTTFLQAQTYTLNWGSSFAPAWSAPGTSGSAANIGGSGINCSVAMSSSGGAATFISPYPRVNGTGDFTVGGSAGEVEIDMDFTANTQYTDVVYTFSSSVTHVVFNIADIDKASATSVTYIDKVVVTGSDGATTFNPVITKYTAASNIVVISGNTATANTTSGQGGTSASSAADQNGTVIIDFGTAVIKSITIRYQNAAGVQANPALQAIAIGNISFQKTALLPVDVVQFTGELKNASANLHWVTTSEINVSKYAVERSIDGINFTGVAILPAKLSATNDYFFIDNVQNINSKNIYYRLQMIDADGKYKFSAVLKITTANQINKAVGISPNPVTDKMNVSISSAIAGTGSLRLINNSGQVVFQQNERIVKGENLIAINKLQYLTAGIYTLQVIIDNEVMVTKLYKY